MTTYSSGQIAIACHGKLTGDPSSVVSRLLIDSRSVYDASVSIFFALTGSHHDGHRFLSSLFRKGVRHFVVRKGNIHPELKDQANWIEVDDPLDALQDVAGVHRSAFDLPVLAITGSNGKTIVKEWLSQLIGRDMVVTRSPRSYNSQVGVPLSLWNLSARAEMGIFEAGISLSGEMKRLQKIIRPTMGLFTTLGQAHQENFSTLEEKLQEKLDLFNDVETIFYGRDQERVHRTIQERFPGKNLKTWGRASQADLQLMGADDMDDGQQLTLKWEGRTFQLYIPFSDSVSVENVLAAVLFLLFTGYDSDTIARRTQHLVPVAMRLEQKEGMNDNLLINDTYNADITSLGVALDFLVQQSRRKGVTRTVILSDMLQTGVPDDELYPLVASMIREKEIDRFIGVGPALSRYAHAFGESARFFGTTEEMLKAIPSFHFRGEAILVKGSRPFSFERIVTRLEQKRHATVMEINMDALTYNLNRYRQLLDSKVKVLAMVKAFSYGSGSYEIAAALQHHNVDYLGVAFADEGMELRKAGISIPVIVMSPEEKSFDQMMAYNLEPEIYNFRVLEAFNDAAEAVGGEEVPVHIKLDTGMNRMGFLPQEVAGLITRLKQMPALKIRSVFSHLAASDDESRDAFTRHQIETFQHICRELKQELQTDFMMHILNSGGIERFPEAAFDMVRLGIGLYGFGADVIEDLRNVVSLRSFISQIKPVSKGDGIGYNRAGWLDRDGYIGIVPVGYADGLNRHLSNGKGKMMMNGKLVPIVGQICMDMCMIDLTDVDAEEGDDVWVFGDEYPLDNLARQLDTIPYEILTGISRRVSRVYFKE